MIGFISMLLVFGIIGIAIGGLVEIHHQNKGDFSWLPIIFCGTGFFLFGLAMLIKDCYVIRLLHL